MNHWLEHYIACFDVLRCAKYKGKIAPHKPVLLLSIMALFEQQVLNDNPITITPELEAQFQATWQQYVHDSDFQANMGTPFYHMRSEPFWQYTVADEYIMWLNDKIKMRHLSVQKQAGATVYLDNYLIQCFSNASTREQLRCFIEQRYFDNREPQHPPQTQPIISCKVQKFVPSIRNQREENLLKAA